MSEKQIKHEEIDIAEEASEEGSYVIGDGDLQRLDERQRIEARWRKEKVLVNLSAFIILVVLLAAIIQLFFVESDAAADWGRQIMGTLMGFAAGAIFQGSRSTNDG